MKKISSYLFILTAIICCQFSVTSCKEAIRHGQPTIHFDEPVFDEVSQTFSITLSADSVTDARVTFFLLDGEEILMQNETGEFSEIAPLDEGYNVQLSAEWPDTTIVTLPEHVFGFIIPKAPVTPMSKEELEQLINAKDVTIKRGENEYLAQAVSVKIVGNQSAVATLFEAIEKLEQRLWTSAKISDVTYDENNLIIEVTLKPTEKVINEDDYEDEEEYYE